MSANFFLKSIEFKNYRALNNVSIGKFSRVNLIGGYNGTGKSTFLEGIFTLLDRQSPMVLMHPFVWRKMALGNSNDLSQLFYQLDDSKKIEITATTSKGMFCTSMSYGQRPAGITMQVPTSLGNKVVEQQNTQGNEVGMNLETTIDGTLDSASFAMFVGANNLAVNLYRAGKLITPPGIIITAATRYSPQDDANRFSAIVRLNKLPELLKHLAVVRPTLKGMQLLQEAQASVLYAELESGKLLPVSMLGDGFYTVLSIALAIMNLPGGILLLDEFDSAVHYSILEDVWAMIATLANSLNCQVIAVTHSRECIHAAVEGIKKGSSLTDFQYHRLELNNKKTEVVSYSGQELTESLASEWEVR